ncbi:MAG: molybdate ABC transporter permease subunit [Spirochaetales bacterium]|nr:molybdate ABC transporter permease subunit [Spirochaetales bacterium]
MKFDVVPFWVSLQLGLWTTGVLLVFTLPLSWGLSRARGRWVVWIESLFSLPLVVSPTVLGYYLLVFLSPRSPLGHFLQTTLGLRLVFSFPGMVLASCLAGLPFMFAPLKTGFAQIPESLWEASATLGKGKFETFMRVLLPNLRPALITGLISTFAHTLGEFGVVLMVGGSIPGVTKVVSIAIYEHVEALDFDTANLYALILVVLGYAGVFLMNLQLRPPGRTKATR